MTKGKSFNLKMAKESIWVFGVTQKLGKNFIYRHHTEPINSIVRAEKESYPTPMRYVDVTRSTCADLEIAQENKCMTIWMSTRTEIYQFRGRVSQDLRYWTKLLWRMSAIPRWDWRSFRRHHVQITCDLTHWQKLWKQLKEERNKNE